MNLGQFLDGMTIPSYEQVTRGEALGTVTLKYGREGTVQSYHTQYIQMLGIIQDNPGKNFRELALLSEGLDNSQVERSLTIERPAAPIEMLCRFHRMGALYVFDEQGDDFRNVIVGTSATLFLMYRDLAHYETNHHGSRGIEVVAAQPSSRRNVEAFESFFPKIERS